MNMPEVAANTTEAVLQAWEIRENTPFAAGDVLATVETDKAVVDITAETDGVILRTLVSEGDRVEVGSPVALIGEPGERVDDPEVILARLGVAPSRGTAAPPAGDVSGRAATAAAAAAESPLASPAPTTSPGTGAGEMASAAGPAPVETSDSPERVFASPLARRLAREAGIPVGSITGTGPGGRIVRRDVEAAAARLAATPSSAGAPVRPAEPEVTPARRPENVAPPASTASQGSTVSPGSALSPGSTASQGSTTGQGFTDEPHSRIRKAVATRLSESKQTVPHFYLRATVRVDRLLELRRQLNESGPARVSLNDLVIKAAAQAHVRVPAMNVIWTPQATRSFSSVDVAVAIATERGLVTPVLRSVERTTVSSVAAAVKDFAERAKAGRLRQDELEGGSLTVTNLGMFGTEEFMAIINPPQSAILAVGAARQEPVVDDGALTVGTVMRVTLSVDHRPIDGVIAAEWMSAFVSLVENPVRILA
ncbi:2-oxo acid dehydrogenase subunit E2 [Microtetraspora niveoalba]|uniref:2-oxo acid dehydrogenase subunit E2 n=1 Tax=Microtetraspora niveoalba TaxID=46175 RepID=UPI000A76637F|nr:2-oxo acid dehydrogenase subunit E2 [Microtetraspora niveoalba]